MAELQEQDDKKLCVIIEQNRLVLCWEQALAWRLASQRTIPVQYHKHRPISCLILTNYGLKWIGQEHKYVSKLQNTFNACSLFG